MPVRWSDCATARLPSVGNPRKGISWPYPLSYLVAWLVPSPVGNELFDSCQSIGLEILPIGHSGSPTNSRVIPASPENVDSFVRMRCVSSQ